MLKKLQRDRDKEFRHIAPGLIPAASIAPKPAVPRTPPPRSPDPSPERPRSALAAAILSSSLTGQTWAIPPARTRSLSEIDRSESVISEPNISTALYNRDRWSEDLGSRQDLSSSDHSDNELEDKQDKVENEEDGEDHIYQTLDGEAICSITEPLYALPLKSKTKTPLPTQIPDREIPVTESNRCSYKVYDCTSLCEGKRCSSCPEETSNQFPVTSCSKKKVRKSSGRHKQDVPPVPAIQTTDIPSQAKNQKHPTQLSLKPQVHSEVQWETVLPKKTRRADGQKLLEERVQRLEQEISQSQAFSTLRSSAGSQTEIQNLRQQAQELVDENDALKLTVHRLNVELSRYQTCFRPLSKQESSKISGLPKTGTPPPWLVDIKYLSPLLLAYDERMNEKDELLQTIEEEVKRLHVRVEEVVKENDRLHDEMVKNGGFTQKDCHQLQQQAFLVLQENQILIDQLEAQHIKAKATHSRHHSEVSKVSKQLMLLEAENQRLQEDLEESRTEVQKITKQFQALQARQKDVVTWDEHCSITEKLKGQLEQLENRNKIEMDKLLLRVSSLQEENRSLALDKATLTADVERLEVDVKLSRQLHRRAERMMNELKKRKEECALQEEKTRHYLGEVISRAECVSKERDQLIDMASSLQQEKKRFIDKILNGTLRLGKLQDEVKVYRRQASTRLAALEEAAEGKTASYQREILHLQRLLKERQEAEERLLQSKREIEDELEVVWQAATRENQHIKETILDLRFTPDLHGWSICDSASPHQPFRSPDKTTSSNQHQPHSSEPPLFTSNPSPALQRSVFKSDSDCPNNCMDEKQKQSLDFYC